MLKETYDIRVSLSDEFSQQDKREAEMLFAELGKVEVWDYLRESVAELVPIVFILITGAFLNGFFGKMGEDTYDSLKSKLGEFLARNRSSSNPTDIVFEFDYDSTNIKAYTKGLNSDIVQKAMKTLSSIREQLDNQKRKGKLPAPLTRIDYTFDADSQRWKPVSASCAQADDLSRYRYDEGTDSWQTEFHVDPRRLTDSRSES
jgi:hypothetical protein